MSKTAIVVLNYNDFSTTENYINVISRYEVLDKIVVVDNHSTDESFRILKQLNNDKIDVIQTDCNHGYAKGNNYGLNHLLHLESKYDYVIISNPDIIVSEDSIAKLIHEMQHRSRIFAITGEIYTLNGSRIGGFRTKLPTLTMLFLESSVVLRKIFWILFKYGRRYQSDEIDCSGVLLKAESLPGCFFMANFDIFERLGFFDEQTFLYSEEDILFSKSKKAGYNSYVLRDTKIIHAEGTTIKKNISAWKKRERIRERSNTIYMKSCLNTSNQVIGLYKVWNRLFSTERFLNMKLRTKYY